MRIFRYVCGNYINRGVEVCANARMAEMTLADTAIRELLASKVLRPAVLERALDLAVQMVRSHERGDEHARRRADLQKRIARLDGELANLAEVAARDGAVPAVLEALTRKDAERRAAVAELARLQPTTSARPSLDARVLRRQLRAFLARWQDLTTANPTETRELLDTALRERIVFRRVQRDGTSMYELTSRCISIVC